MGRKPRVYQSGGIYHVMSRGNDGQNIFFDSNDYREFIRILDKAKTRFDFKVYAYCLMPNHFHILGRTLGAPLDKVMHWILTCYAKYVTRRRQIRGHLFQSRYKDRSCTDEHYFFTLLRYIHLNPVRGIQVERPEDWPYSGHNELLGKRGFGIVDADFALSFFAADIESAKNRYAKFIEDGIHDCVDAPDPFEVQASGSEGNPAAPSGDNGGWVQAGTGRGVLLRIADETLKEWGMDSTALNIDSRARVVVKARYEFIRRAVISGFRPIEIARFLNCAPSVITSAVGRADLQKSRKTGTS
ncbi:MAG: transposase [Elusimicrobiota bacterium]